MRYLIICLATIIWSCQPAVDQGHVHGEGGHTHEADEKPTLDFTVWTEQTELFVEFPALVVGNVSRFAAHFTILDGHKPVEDGQVTVSLIKGEKGIRQTADGPSSPGIFTPALQPKEAGICQLIFELESSNVKDRIVLSNVQVFASLDEAEAGLGNNEEEDGAITFLKEQAWKMEFQTAQVTEKEIYEVISTIGIWKVAPSDDQVLMASATGIINHKPRYLTEGKVIRKGEVLMEVTSSDLTTNNLSSEIQKTKVSLEQAKASYDRINKLYQNKIGSKTDFDKVKEKYLLAKTNYETLTSGFSGEGKQVIAPFDGYILEVYARNGEFAEQGTPLMKITIDQNHMLQTLVNTSHATALEEIHDLRYQNGEGEWSGLKATGGKVISVSREVSIGETMLSVYSEVQEDIHMPDGSYTEVQVEVGKPSKSWVIPSSALLEDYGQYSVIVQLSGESFERRSVTIGKQNGSEVEIKRGLFIGEVVVTKGAYQVKMASMSGQAPAHGHAH